MNEPFEALLSVARSVVDKARKSGADVAEVSAGQGWELSAQVRLGEVELVEEAGHRGISLRVRRDDRVAASSTSDLRPEGLDQCVQHAVELLDLSQPDLDSRFAEFQALYCTIDLELGLYDPELENLGTD